MTQEELNEKLKLYQEEKLKLHQQWQVEQSNPRISFKGADTSFAHTKKQPNIRMLPTKHRCLSLYLTIQRYAHS